jgi:hypothetical protein
VGLLHELVGGTADGDAEGGSAGLAVFHTFDGNGAACSRCGSGIVCGSFPGPQVRATWGTRQLRHGIPP